MNAGACGPKLAATNERVTYTTAMEASSEYIEYLQTLCIYIAQYKSNPYCSISCGTVVELDVRVKRNKVLHSVFSHSSLADFA